jgi:predicted translin family RNA/ssDNA-binding protein
MNKEEVIKQFKEIARESSQVIEKARTEYFDIPMAMETLLSVIRKCGEAVKSLKNSEIK